MADNPTPTPWESVHSGHPTRTTVVRFTGVNEGAADIQMHRGESLQVRQVGGVTEVQVVGPAGNVVHPPVAVRGDPDVIRSLGLSEPRWARVGPTYGHLDMTEGAQVIERANLTQQGFSRSGWEPVTPPRDGTQRIAVTGANGGSAELTLQPGQTLGVRRNGLDTELCIFDANGNRTRDPLAVKGEPEAIKSLAKAGPANGATDLTAPKVAAEAEHLKTPGFVRGEWENVSIANQRGALPAQFISPNNGGDIHVEVRPNETLQVRQNGTHTEIQVLDRGGNVVHPSVAVNGTPDEIKAGAKVGPDKGILDLKDPHAAGNQRVAQQQIDTHNSQMRGSTQVGSPAGSVDAPHIDGRANVVVQEVAVGAKTGSMLAETAAKVGKKAGALAPLVAGGIALAGGASVGTAGAATLEAVVPGSSTGFKNVIAAKPADTALNVAETGLGIVTIGATAGVVTVGAVPLAVAAVSLEALRDVAHLTGLADHGGLISESLKRGEITFPTQLSVHDAVSPLAGISKVMASGAKDPALSEGLRGALAEFSGSKIASDTGVMKPRSTAEFGRTLNSGAHLAQELARALKAPGAEGDAVRAMLKSTLDKAHATPEQFAETLQRYASLLESGGKFATDGAKTMPLDQYATKLREMMEGINGTLKGNPPAQGQPAAPNVDTRSLTNKPAQPENGNTPVVQAEPTGPRSAALPPGPSGRSNAASLRAENSQQAAQASVAPNAVGSDAQAPSEHVATQRARQASAPAPA